MEDLLSQHERIAVHFSGGKDSLAVTYLLRPYWDRLVFYHVDTGDLLPEVREIVAEVAAKVPTFKRIETNSQLFCQRIGLPSDLVPTSCTVAGLMLGMGQRRIVDRFECCGANIMLPMHNRMVDDGITLVIRGTKRCDLKRLPAEDGDTSLGYRLWLPIIDWSHDDVFSYLREVGAPICRVYETAVNSPECATCTAWWSEKRAAYLFKHHPLLHARYMAKLKLVTDEVAPMIDAMREEAGE